MGAAGELSARLRAIADLVTEGYAVCDVGCDHGFVPIALVREGKAPCALASDINAGPLLRAEAHIAEAGAEDRIRTERCPGIPKKLEEKLPEPAAVVIAGMGGTLIRRILLEGSPLPETVKELVLSPHSDWELVRGVLPELHFAVEREAFLIEDGKYYPVIGAVPAEDPPVLTAEELHFGPVLLAARDPALHVYLTQREAYLKQLLEMLRDGGHEARAASLQEELAITERALARYGNHS